MDEALREAFQSTDYRVSAPAGSSLSIRVGQLLPPQLSSLLPRADTCWGYITACNPRATPRALVDNERAQRQLLAQLRRRVPHSRILQGDGIGADGWREPSLFIIDVPLQVLDALMHQFDQYAIVQGIGAGPATLRWNPDLTE